MFYSSVRKKIDRSTLGHYQEIIIQQTTYFYIHLSRPVLVLPCVKFIIKLNKINVNNYGKLFNLKSRQSKKNKYKH